MSVGVGPARYLFCFFYLIKNLAAWAEQDTFTFTLIERPICIKTAQSRATRRPVRQQDTRVHVQECGK